MTEANKYIIEIPMLEMPKLKGMGQLIFEKMSEHKDKIAQTDTLTGETQTYREILEKSIRIATYLRSMGIKPKDIVTICSHSTMECFVPFYGSFFIGAVTANLEPLLPLSDAVHLLKQIRPKIIFVLPEALELIEKALQESKLDVKIVVFGPTSKYMNYYDIIKQSCDENNFTLYEVKNFKDTAVIVFSSGTTGMPKGSCLTYYGLEGYIYQLGLAPAPDISVLTFSNLFWIGAVVLTTPCLYYGWNRLIYPRFKEGRPIWDILAKYKVNYLSANPYQVLDICKEGRPKNADTSHLKVVTVPGGLLSLEQIDHIRTCFQFPKTLVYYSYGQTELTTHTLRFRPSFLEEDLRLLSEKPLSIGRPVPGCTYKIVDVETKEILGPNREGELLIKSEFTMNGYYNMDSSHVWDAEGFMYTGDLVYYDEDYCFFIVDRLKDILKYQMWHISPSKLEAILYTHPAVQTCIVTGLPHPVDGDHLIGVVVLKESANGKVTGAELEKYVNVQVADYQKIREGIKIVKSIPLTVTDKTSRRLVKELILEGKL